jgi:hypothetical protein
MMLGSDRLQHTQHTAQSVLCLQDLRTLVHIRKFLLLLADPSAACQNEYCTEYSRI